MVRNSSVQICVKPSDTDSDSIMCKLFISERVEPSNTQSGCLCWLWRREQSRLFTAALGRDGRRYVLSETAIITLSHLVGVVYQVWFLFTERKR